MVFTCIHNKQRRLKTVSHWLFPVWGNKHILILDTDTSTTNTMMLPLPYLPNSQHQYDISAWRNPHLMTGHTYLCHWKQTKRYVQYAGLCMFMCHTFSTQTQYHIPYWLVITSGYLKAMWMYWIIYMACCCRLKLHYRYTDFPVTAAWGN